jgi:hypothetical protein
LENLEGKENVMDPSLETHARGTGGSHAGQWGLAAILLTALVLLLFPLLVGLMLASMWGAYNDVFLESRDIDLGLRGGWAVVGGIVGLALFALVCAVMGLAAATSRRQPIGLSLAGTVLSLIGLATSVVLLLVAIRTDEWIRWLQKERFERGIQYPSPQHK